MAGLGYKLSRGSDVCLELYRLNLIEQTPPRSSQDQIASFTILQVKDGEKEQAAFSCRDMGRLRFDSVMG